MVRRPKQLIPAPMLCQPDTIFDGKFGKEFITTFTGRLGTETSAGAAFERIPYSKKMAQLHDPSSWKPRQLAISLLSLEGYGAYQTVEKKINQAKKELTNRI
jgi:hypothetical protein